MLKSKMLLVAASLCIALAPVGQATASPHDATSFKTYRNPVMGVKVKLLKDLRVVESDYAGDTYGFSVMDEGEDERTLLTVFWLINKAPNEIATESQKAQAEILNAGIAVANQAITVGDDSASAIAGVPSLEETSITYLRKQGRLYQVIYASNDKVAQDMLGRLRFFKPEVSYESLELPAEDAIQPLTAEESATALSLKTAQEPATSSGVGPVANPTTDAVSTDAALAAIEPNAVAGCTDFPTWKTLVTPWSSSANGSGTAYALGWSKSGPSFWNEGLHTRCNTAGYLNDRYAIDFPLKRYDTVYAMASGTVVYVGRASGGFCGLGRIAIVDAGNGYKWMGAHLQSISAYVGQLVSAGNTAIGKAGGSGCTSDSNWGTHLHSGLYYKCIHWQRWFAQRPKCKTFANQLLSQWWWRIYVVLSWNADELLNPIAQHNRTASMT